MPRKKKSQLNIEISYLIDRFYQVEKHRVAIGLQIGQLKKDKVNIKFLKEFFDRFFTLEKDIKKLIADTVAEHPMWSWLKKVDGIGPILAAALLANLDIRKAKHISSFWKYCGLAVTPEGTAERKTRGERIAFNPFLKSISWKIGESFVKIKGKYRKMYDTSKAFYQKKFPKKQQALDAAGKPRKNAQGGKIMLYSKGHIHAMAKRRAVKRFLADFWTEWRTIEGLAVNPPYSHRSDVK